MMGRLPSFLLLAIFLRCSQQSTTTWPESIVSNVLEVKDLDLRQQFVDIIPRQLQSTDSELSNMGFVAASTPSLDSIYSTTGIVLCWKLLLRSLYLLFLYLPTLLLSPFAYFSVNFREAIWFPLLRASIASSGAAFIKWGQWASSRPDIFSQSLCDQLSILQADAPKHGFAYTQQQVLNELGVPLNTVFQSFEREPIASGSIAQVYRALLRLPIRACPGAGKSAHSPPPQQPQQQQSAVCVAAHVDALALAAGREFLPVAVKVRHPNVEEHIALDFHLMNGVAYLVDHIPGCDWLRLGESMQQFSSVISSQTDLATEGRHLQAFNRHFDGRQWADVGFPQPLLSSSGVLVETFIPGRSVKVVVEDMRGLWLAAGTEQGKEHVVDLGGKLLRGDVTKDQLHTAHFIVTRGEDIFLKMLIQDTLMHADLHPGNILFEEGSQEQGRAMHISLVDAGMVSTPTVEERMNVVGLLEALGEGRGDEAADCILRFSSLSTSSLSSERAVAFREDMVALFAKVCRGYHTEVSVAAVMKGVLQLVQLHRVSIGANYAALLMNLICLDGMAQQLLPVYNVLDGAKLPLRLHRVIRQLLRILHFPSSAGQKLLSVTFPSILRMKKLLDGRFLRRLLKRIGR